MIKHDDFCPCSRFDAALVFCNCEAGNYGNPALVAKDEKSQRAFLPAGSATGWRRKRGQARKPGFRRLNDHRPIKIHKFATTRLKDIAALLQEIELLYADADQYIVDLCEELRSTALAEIQAGVDERFRDDQDKENDRGTVELSIGSKSSTTTC